MSAGVTFDWHTHADHQLAWAAAGVLIVRDERGHPGRCRRRGRCGYPPGRRHETLSARAATMRTRTSGRGCARSTGLDFTPVAASPSLAELIGYLAGPISTLAVDSTQRR